VTGHFDDLVVALPSICCTGIVLRNDDGSEDTTGHAVMLMGAIVAYSLYFEYVCMFDERLPKSQVCLRWYLSNRGSVVYKNTYRASIFDALADCTSMARIPHLIHVYVLPNPGHTGSHQCRPTSNSLMTDGKVGQLNVCYVQMS
jgi:hypothetical protein